MLPSGANLIQVFFYEVLHLPLLLPHHYFRFIIIKLLLYYFRLPRKIPTPFGLVNGFDNITLTFWISFTIQWYHVNKGLPFFFNIKRFGQLLLGTAEYQFS